MGSPSFLPLYHKQAGAVLRDCLHCGDSAALGAETSPAAPSKRSNSIGDYSPKSGTSRKKWPKREGRGAKLWKISGLSQDFQQLLGDHPARAVHKA